LIAAGLLLSWGAIDRHVRAARLLIGFQDAAGDAVPGIEADDTTLAGLRARVYRDSSGGPPVMLVHGVHAGGIDEPRFVHFAQLLVEAGFTVGTPEIEAMTDLVLDPASASEVGDAAVAFGQRQGTSSVAIVGISFGGGLALIAAAERPAAIHAVWAIGAPHDLTALVAWWSGGDARGPHGESVTAEPEAYGAEVLAYSFADDFFSAEDLELGRAVLGAHLRGDHEASRTLRRGAPASLEASLVAAGHPGARIRALGERHRDVLLELSPARRLAHVTARVFLLHGLGDPVVASTETLHLARDLGGPEAVLLTGLLGHADASPDPGWAEQWHLVHHAAGVLEGLSSGE